ncbi:hypothetical protein, partial [Rhizobium tropici]|uniref:hypothetical protein n=1 Tax=Rhizobium tropici TaxID=398 RepID=UPI001A925207
FCGATIFIDTHRQTWKCIKYRQGDLSVWRRRFASPHNAQSRAKRLTQKDLSNIFILRAAV